MFKAERIYEQRNNMTGLTEWFFWAREGIFGPYASRQETARALEDFKKFCIENGSDGGRSQKNGASSSKLSLLPMEHDSYNKRRKEIN